MFASFSYHFVFSFFISYFHSEDIAIAIAVAIGLAVEFQPVIALTGRKQQGSICFKSVSCLQAIKIF
jgi:hypothetical protein